MSDKKDYEREEVCAEEKKRKVSWRSQIFKNEIIC